MRLVEISCSKCGGQMQINPELKKCVCVYCGNEMLIDDEVVHHTLDNGFSFGYEQEMGRLKAQEDYLLQKEKEKREEAARQRTAQENSAKRAQEIQAMFKRELDRREGRINEEHIYLSK